MRLRSFTSRSIGVVAAITACLVVTDVRSIRAQTPIAIELVLAVDTSLSVNDIEFGLQMHGIARAFRSDEVIRLIGLYDGVAVTLIQWAGWVSEEHTVPWRLLTTPESVRSFADEVARTRRDSVGRFTAIGTAIEAGLEAIATNRFAGRRLKIDVSGDGRSNAGPPPTLARDEAASRAVTINGLTVLTDDHALENYFRKNVIAGPAAFTINATSYDDFARAIKIKLLRELAPEISQDGGAVPYKNANVR